MNAADVKTKKDFLALAAELGVEIDDDERESRPSRFTGAKAPRHIHAYAPVGSRFEATDTHNIGLGEYRAGERIDWRALAIEITLTPCDGIDDNGGPCEYCNEGEHE
jgi:hypothetical protein